MGIDNYKGPEEPNTYSTELRNAKKSKKAKVDFQSALHEVEQITSLPTDDFRQKLKLATTLVHKLYSTCKENLATEHDLQTITNFNTKFKEISGSNPKVFKKLQTVQNILRLNVQEAQTTSSCITSSQMQQMTPRVFWDKIAEILTKNPSLDYIELEGYGSFDRKDLAGLVALDAHIEPQKLQSFIAKLTKTSFRLRNIDKDKYTPLHLHIIAGRADLIASDLQNIPVDTPDVGGFTALQWACYLGDVDAAKQLIQAKADINFGSAAGRSPLYQAVIAEELPIIELLLSEGVPCDLPDMGMGMTPLVFAISMNYTNIAKFFIEHGANVNGTDSEGWTCLMLAATNSNAEIVKTLLQNDADINIRDNSGYTVLGLLKMTRGPHSKKIRQVIENHCCSAAFAKAKDYKKVFNNTKLLSHAYSVKGTSIIQEQKIQLTGYYSQTVARTAAKSIQSFTKELPHLLDKASSRHLTQSLNFAADLSGHTTKQTLKRINKGLPTILLTGYTEHAVTVLIWNDLFIHCDRSGRFPLSIHRFDPAKLNEKSLQLLMDVKEKSADEYIDALFERLPHELGFTQTENEQELQKIAALPMQTVGNCSWASIEGVIKGFLLLNALKKTSFQLPQDPLEQKEIKAAIDQTFTSWQLFMQIELLDKYLEHPVDRGLIFMSFLMLWGAKPTEPWAAERIQQLEAKYRAAAGYSDYLAYLTHKVMSNTSVYSLPWLSTHGYIDIIDTVQAALL